MSEKLYRLLLKLYPDDFRRTYGDEALRLVRDRSRSESGFLSGLRLWMDLLLDLAISLPREYSKAPSAPIVAAQPGNGEGSFQLLAESSLDPSLLCLGCTLSAALFWTCVFVVAHSGGFPPLLPMLSAQVAQLSGSASTGEKHPAFEVISIKRHIAESGPVQLGPTPDGFRSIGLPMIGIFQWAFALPNQPGLLRADRIEGDPRWLSDELYDVVAKVDQADLAGWQKPAMRLTMLRAMLQDMLATRCQLVAHYGSKEAPVYDLVTAKGGPKFKAAETVDIAELRRRRPGGGIMMGSGAMGVAGPTTTQFYAIPMAILASTILPSFVDRPVLDKTGLTGYYDLALPSSVLRRRPPSPPPGASPPPDAPSPALEDESIFAALEAVGLRLTPAKGQVEMLVIDHVERPSEN